MLAFSTFRVPLATMLGGMGTLSSLWEKDLSQESDLELDHVLVQLLPITHKCAFHQHTYENVVSYACLPLNF